MYELVTIFEKVETSTFENGFGRGYTARPDAKVITMGNIPDLEHQKFEEIGRPSSIFVRAPPASF